MPFERMLPVLQDVDGLPATLQDTESRALAEPTNSNADMVVIAATTTPMRRIDLLNTLYVPPVNDATNNDVSISVEAGTDQAHQRQLAGTFAATTPGSLESVGQVGVRRPPRMRRVISRAQSEADHAEGSDVGAMSERCDPMIEAAEILKKT